jgi:hypothetical protein
VQVAALVNLRGAFARQQVVAVTGDLRITDLCEGTETARLDYESQRQVGP